MCEEPLLEIPNDRTDMAKEKEKWIKRSKNIKGKKYKPTEDFKKKCIKA